MFKITEDFELKKAFREIDQPAFEPPAEAEYPMFVTDYVTWSEPSGHRVFLVFSDPAKGEPLGIVFERGSSAVPGMCEWCHSVRSGNGVSLLLAKVDGQRRVGLHLCRNLECQKRLSADPGADDFPRTGNSVLERKKVLSRMAEFFRQQLV